MVYESQYAPVETPENEDIWSFIFERKDQKAYSDDKVLLIDSSTGRSYTYTQTRDTAIDFAKGLKHLWGWKRGEVLCLFAPNCIDTPPIMWGTHWVGGVVTPANPAYNVEELTYQLKTAGARAIVTMLPFLETAKKAAKAVGIEEDCVVLMGDRDPTYRTKHFTGIRNTTGTSRFKRTKNKPDDVAFLPFSSGTTGNPKGCMLTHRNITVNVRQIHASESLYLKQGDVMMGCLPFFHIYGLTVLIHANFWAGHPLVVMPKYDIEGFCKAIQDYKITFAYVAPPIAVQLTKSPVVDKYDLSSIRMLSSGAAPLTSELTLELHEKRKLPLKQGYGLTETSPTTHVQRWEHWQSKMGSVGMLLPNQIAKFVDDDDKEVEPGTPGELWLKGPNVFKGYLNNPEANANAFSSDGYFKTGDIGYHDADGAFYITDRKKELIKYHGYQVPPAELEGKLLGHPNVDDVAVVGVTDKQQATELPRAYIVLKSGNKADDATAKEIDEWLTARVTHYKRLRGGIRFIDAIPKSPSGKILRRVIKDQIAKEEQQGRAKL